MDSGLKKERRPNPRENAFFLSAITFFYTIPTFIQGYTKQLNEGDLTETLNEHKSGYLGDKMEESWRKEEIKAAKHKRKASLGKVLHNVFGWEFWSYGVALLISEAIRINQPLFLGRLVSYFNPEKHQLALDYGNSTLSDNKQVAQPIFLGWLVRFYTPGSTEITETDAYIYAAAVIISTLVNVLVVHPYMLGVVHLGMKMRVACCSLIYRKSLRLSKTSLGQTTAGQVVNLMSNDVNRFDLALIFAHQLWVGPLETIIITYLMYLQVGISAVIGVVFILMFIPLQIYLGKMVSVLRLKTALRTDERVRLMNEIISGIQVIKMYAWEKPFAKLVHTSRKKEIKFLRITSYIRGIMLSFIMFSTRMSIFVSILSFVLLGNEITAEKVFVLAAFYNILRQTMTVFFPQGIALFAEGTVSISRLNKFMLYSEKDTEHKSSFSSSTGTNGALKSSGSSTLTFTSSIIKPPTNEPGIVMKNAVAKWSENSMDDTLNNVSLTVEPRKLLAIIGQVGSGKSSILQAILNELPLKEGSLTVNGELSYASQEPWLFAGSVRQNILFGLPLDRPRYKAVVKYCALERDFSLLPYSDKTIVGDRGVSLSGGQRARINLARAVYKNADIYLLDDPLSAVDTHVGKELFEKCITGYLREKTVILITHQLQYLKQVDHIILMDSGVIKAEGSFNELQKMGLDFTKVLGTSEENAEIDQIDKKKGEKDVLVTRQNSIKSVSSEDLAPQVVEEQMSKGKVGGYVYSSYFKAGGNCCMIFFMFLLFLFTQLLASAADYFITYWVNIEQQTNLENKNSTQKHNGTIAHDNHSHKDDFWHFSRNTSIYIYSAIMALLVIITLARSFTFFTMCMRSSVRLHNNMFQSVTMATMRFFNTNSAGRILNRFSKDMGAIDELLTSAMIDCLQIGLALAGIIVVISIVSPWMLVPTLIIGVIIYLLRVVYIRTGSNVKRLEGVTRSPVFSHLNATLNGLTTIRAFGAQKILIREFDNHQDLHSSAFFSFISISRAFGYFLDLTGVIYITFVTFSFLLLGNEKFGGNVGLAITQAIGITGMLQWGMRQSTELENQMTSVERVLEYQDLEHEADLESKPDKKPPENWPSEGRIEFRGVYLSYFSEDPPVLKNLSFTVLPKEKVGIVGRTGAGKSSLINAVFQLTPTEGQIIIDGVNVTEIGLHDLRTKISIIPQEPVLFSGTMRKNLDPFDEYSDATLWRALEDVELKEVVLDLTSGLNSQMSEGGSNLSVGQRQLVCLARAILRNNKILVLDEATANVDPQTDVLIQKTIRTNFADCTVLTIAHRLHTVMDSDKVLVMDAGTLKEFDHPHILLQNTKSILYGMVQQTGNQMKDTLLKTAEESYNARTRNT